MLAEAPVGYYETITDPAVNEGRPYKAYIPSRLQDLPLALPSPVQATIDRATRRIAEIDARLGGSPSLPALETLVKSEAIASSYIEGHQISAKALATESNDIRSATDDVKAVLANIEATHRAVRTLEERGRPVTIEDVVRIQTDLMQFHPSGGPRSPHVGLRTTQAVLIPPDAVRSESASISAATHVPPPAKFVAGAMADLIAYINEPPISASPLVRAALAHAQFETVHPFPDGNGRTGRALIQGMLRRDGALKHVVLPLSPYLAMNPAQYVNGLNSVRFEGAKPDAAALSQWCETFAECAYSAAVNAGEVAQRIDALGAEWAERLSAVGVRSGAAAHRVIPHLLGAGATTARTVASELGVGEDTARTALGRLEKIGAVIVSRLPNGVFVYTADEVADIITSSQRDIAVRRDPAAGPVVVGGTLPLTIPDLDRRNNRSNPPAMCDAWMPRSRKRCNLREGHAGWPEAGHRHIGK